MRHFHWTWFWMQLVLALANVPFWPAPFNAFACGACAIGALNALGNALAK